MRVEYLGLESADLQGVECFAIKLGKIMKIKNVKEKGFPIECGAGISNQETPTSQHDQKA
jgi:hypothetical protein